MSLYKAINQSNGGCSRHRIAFSKAKVWAQIEADLRAKAEADAMAKAEADAKPEIEAGD
jgi:hypothetical protein